ncbi:hypothetical protein JTB14_001354 [Gonioctena quinquepunctata]|nr:hypothetical protein JTB14_001354 [Gonioctena quinquepunctata]
MKIKNELFVNTKSNVQFLRLLEVKKFAEYDVEVVAHSTLNISKGVIFCKDLLNCTMEEIMRCFKSQAFGHVANICTKEQICACGNPPYEGSPCEEPKKCVNCNGPHSSGYKNCPTYKKEQLVQQIKVG